MWLLELIEEKDLQGRIRHIWLNWKGEIGWFLFEILRFVLKFWINSWYKDVNIINIWLKYGTVVEIEWGNVTTKREIDEEHWIPES